MEEQLCGGDSLEPLATSLSLELEDLMLVRLAQGISSPSCRGKKRVLSSLPPHPLPLHYQGRREEGRLGSLRGWHVGTTCQT